MGNRSLIICTVCIVLGLCLISHASIPKYSFDSLIPDSFIESSHVYEESYDICGNQTKKGAYILMSEIRAFTPKTVKLKLHTNEKACGLSTESFKQPVPVLVYWTLAQEYNFYVWDMNRGGLKGIESINDIQLESLVYVISISSVVRGKHTSVDMLNLESIQSIRNPRSILAGLTIVEIIIRLRTKLPAGKRIRYLTKEDFPNGVPNYIIRYLIMINQLVPIAAKDPAAKWARQYQPVFQDLLRELSE